MKAILLASFFLAVTTFADSNSPETATYVFPTTPELAPFASFALSGFSYSNTSGNIQVAYQNLSLDQNQIALYLSQTVSDPQELSQRRNVALLFGGEPIGVVTYNY